jgi:hypothetical protein
VGSKKLAVANISKNKRKEANTFSFCFKVNILMRKTVTEVIYSLQSEYFKAKLNEYFEANISE